MSFEKISVLYQRLVYYNHEMITKPDLRTIAHSVFYKYVLACLQIKKTTGSVISKDNVLVILQKFLDQLIINYLYHHESDLFGCSKDSSWKSSWNTFHKTVFIPVFLFVYEYAFRVFPISQEKALQTYGEQSFRSHWNSIGASYRIINCLPPQIGRKIHQQY